MELQKRVYLGDGAYCEFTGWNFRVFTSNGSFETNEVFLEPEHIAVLNSFVSAMTKSLKNQVD